MANKHTLFDYPVDKPVAAKQVPAWVGPLALIAFVALLVVIAVPGIF